MLFPLVPDGVAIASASLRYLATRTSALTLFATHYTSLAQLATVLPHQVAAYYLAYKEHPEHPRPDAPAASASATSSSTASPSAASPIVLLYKAVPGVAPRSFGFHVAQMAGLPASVVERGLVAADRAEEAALARVLGGRRRLATVAAVIRAVRGVESLDGAGFGELIRASKRARRALDATDPPPGPKTETD